MRIVKYNLAGALALLFLLSGCGAMFPWGKSLIITGESLDGIGKQFVRIGEMYKHGCDVAVPRTIQQPQCASFRAFGTHFQKTFPLNRQLWEAARSANDTRMTGKVEDIIGDLAETLTGFSLSVMTLYGGK